MRNKNKTMKLEDITCSLQLSKKLRALGIKQDSLFYHFTNPNTDKIKASYGLLDYNVTEGTKRIGKEIKNIRDLVLDGIFASTHSAFTLEELHALMPLKLMHKDITQSLGYWQRDDKLWFCYYAPALKDCELPIV